ncbi:estradiol 17-beta-dehydrogenase 8-like isoform X1 [Portunus trituberculatus]|uniref:estradiol 17-beta-dehydrogenase 8-like isoform X1 n=2 Tax=Portunus trituberculatus TaxID=210409 RepID=UPI001E1CC46B|nr:estradiol 17-beta-dehydrogenase 8-like isoform X1 [Portunus trituberculatus]XP_045109047.1 estradiol 17-beta-dehydrogenase 8-like isoform X1 [Portunus trituberculatus]XP_045109048.1 estradiol 17-beta-dehydrogenase 8-like isoform X1 [Portunus trituberculatus]
MLSGKIALVTGGGSGIGRAVCRLLARDGARVVATDMDGGAAQETINMLKDRDDHLSLKMDVTDKTSVESAISAAIDKYKAPPSLITNAAGIIRDNFMLQMDEKSFMEVLDVNLKGTYLVTQVATMALAEHDASSGSIVNISSISGKLGTIGQSNYSASKAGVIGFTKSTAMELASMGVRVNCVLPGFTQTAMVGGVPDKVVKLILKMTPLKRMAQPEEIAEVVAFLLSDKSSFMTGASVEVTGGLGM